MGFIAFVAGLSIGIVFGVAIAFGTDGCRDWHGATICVTNGFVERTLGPPSP